MFAPQVAPWVKKFVITSKKNGLVIDYILSSENWFPTEIPTYQK